MPETIYDWLFCASIVGPILLFIIAFMLNLRKIHYNKNLCMSADELEDYCEEQRRESSFLFAAYGPTAAVAGIPITEDED
jgi:hypothetical protein